MNERLASGVRAQQGRAQEGGPQPSNPETLNIKHGARQLVAGHARDALAQQVQRGRVVGRAVQQVGQLVREPRGLLPGVQPGVRAQERRQRCCPQPRQPGAARCLRDTARAGVQACAEQLHLGFLRACFNALG